MFYLNIFNALPIIVDLFDSIHAIQLLKMLRVLFYYYAQYISIILNILLEYDQFNPLDRIIFQQFMIIMLAYFDAGLNVGLLDGGKAKQKLNNSR